MKNSIRSLINQWRFLLVVTIIFLVLAGGFYLVHKPTYSATGALSVNPIYFTHTSDPASIFSSDAMIGLVAEKFDVDADSIEVKVTKEKTDASVIRITVESKNPDNAVEMANYWGELVMDWGETHIKELDTISVDAKEELEGAYTQLAQYLQANELETLRWVDIVALTGVGGSNVDTTTVYSDQQRRIAVTAQQRQELATIVRDLSFLTTQYNMLKNDLLEITYSADTEISFLNYAKEPEKTSLLDSILIIPAGGFVGLFAGICLLLWMDWWKSSDDDNVLSNE